MKYNRYVYIYIRECMQNTTKWGNTPQIKLRNYVKSKIHVTTSITFFITAMNTLYFCLKSFIQFVICWRKYGLETYKIWDSCDSEHWNYRDYHVLRYDALYSARNIPTFWWNRCKFLQRYSASHPRAECSVELVLMVYSACDIKRIRYIIKLLSL